MNKNIDNMRIAGKALRRILDELIKYSVPGRNLLEIESYARTLCEKENVKPECLNYHGYPAVLCLNHNNTLQHGIPRDVILKSGDTLGIDTVVSYMGDMADAANTIPIGEADSDKRMFLKSVKYAMDKAIAIVKPGVKISSLTKIMDGVLRANAYDPSSVFTGHGIGRKMHEFPEIPCSIEICFGKSCQYVLKKDDTIAIEVIASMGNSDVDILKDGWTAVTKDNSRGGHFEHTVLVTEKGYEILTL